MANFTPAKTGNSRVFLIDGRAGPAHKPSFESCLVAGGPDQSFGDIEKIECPDPDRYGQWVEVGTIQGQQSRVTMDLTGRYATDLISTLLDLARKRCAVDVQVHFGACKDPGTFNSFDKAMIFENAYITNWSTGELGALGSDGNAAVDETAPISAEMMYEVVPLATTERGATTVVNELVDVVICDLASCGDCTTPSTGCDHIYAISIMAGGSPATIPDIVHSIDGGATWYTDDIDSMTTDGSAIGCLGDYLVAVSNGQGALHYALKSEVDDVDFDETWVAITTGFVATHDPTDVWEAGGVLWIAAELGYVYMTESVTDGVTVLDAGVATAQTLNAIHALDDQFAVAVGNDGAVVFTENQTVWSSTDAVPTASVLNAVWALSNDTWLVGDADGILWYTENQGADWTNKKDFGAAIQDISFATDSVGYVACTTAAGHGQIWRTYDGGYSWTGIPEGTGSLPANDRINALATCPDANFVIGVGLADDGSDGIIIGGEA
jgi:hypothetical protein